MDTFFSEAITKLGDVMRDALTNNGNVKAVLDAIAALGKLRAEIQRSEANTELLIGTLKQELARVTVENTELRQTRGVVKQRKRELKEDLDAKAKLDILVGALDQYGIEVVGLDVEDPVAVRLEECE